MMAQVEATPAGTKIMQIRPINDQTIEPAFVEFVTRAIGLASVHTCDLPGCKNCAPGVRPSREFVHFSRDEIEGWQANGLGNQLCWSQFIADTQPDIDSITDQPCRAYKLLCLIKVAECDRLNIREVKGKNAIHFGITFAIPRPKMVRIRLNFDKRTGRYVCKEQL